MFCFKGFIKRPRVSSEQDLQKASSLQQSTTSVQSNLRTLRPRQANNNSTSHSLSSSPLISDQSVTTTFHRQSSSSSISSSHGSTATSLQLRSTHVCCIFKIKAKQKYF